MEPLTPEELRLVADAGFFDAKARIMGKVRAMLDQVHAALRTEVAAAALTGPDGFDRNKFQFVKGEQLEHCPYQYLDFPKHFDGEDSFTFRSLFWWGHAFIFAMLLEGRDLLTYKRNLINRYHQVAGQGLVLSLAPTMWEWKHGEGYTLALTHERKSEAAAVLAGRRFVKLSRVLPPDDPLVVEGRVAEAAAATFRAMLPILAR